MPSAPPAPLHTIAFGTPPDGPWGAAWVAHPDGSGLLVVVRGADVSAREARMELDGTEETWRIHSDGAVLTVEAAGEPVELPAEGRGPSGYAQRCQASGPPLGDHPQAGVRGERHPEAELDRYDSVREVCLWFDDEEAASITALRPRKRRGHEEDQVAAAVLSSEPWGPPVDPRLSTAYSSAGAPTRMGLELWSADEQQHPRRYAGEALSDGVRATASGWQVHITPLRCHGHGRDGTGVYLLARPA